MSYLDATSVLYKRATLKPEVGRCICTGKTAVFYGKEDSYDDGKGHMLVENQPLAVCDKTAVALQAVNAEIYVGGSALHYSGGGCLLT
jgi:hypothetical protein